MGLQWVVLGDLPWCVYGWRMMKQKSLDVQCVGEHASKHLQQYPMDSDARSPCSSRDRENVLLISDIS